MISMQNNKKGLSEIVTSILIILIAVAAVVVIWQVLLPLIKTPGAQSASLADCVGNPVTLTQPECKNGGVATVRVTKLGGKAIDTGKIIFSLEDGGSSSEDINVLTNIAGTKIARVTNTAFTSKPIIITGSYKLSGATTDCNIPEVVTVNCPT